ncbi:MAG: 3-isopropylmalate dehydrogenase [Cyanobacteria bacterium P01_H01_bin.74]
MQSTHKILVLRGDGIGPEIMTAAITVLRSIEARFQCGSFELIEGLIGGVAIDKMGVPLPEETLALAKECDAILMAAVGDTQYDKLDPAIRPEKGLLQIRKALGLFANLRPVKGFVGATGGAPLKADRIENVDLLVVRELTGGIYFGDPRMRTGEGPTEKAIDTMVYTRAEIEQILRIAFEAAQTRRKHVTSVDKANVLASSQLWRDVADEISSDYPDVTLTHLYVDNAAMQLVVNPKQFDVLVTGNLFGDILSDEASVLIGSLGMLPSASLGKKVQDHQAKGNLLKMPALYEPAHGSAPSLKGKNEANPIAQILSVALMLGQSFGYHQEAAAISTAIQSVLDTGYRTADIASENSKICGTDEMANRIASEIGRQ